MLCGGKNCFILFVLPQSIHQTSVSLHYYPPSYLARYFCSPSHKRLKSLSSVYFRTNDHISRSDQSKKPTVSSASCKQYKLSASADQNPATAVCHRSLCAPPVAARFSVGEKCLIQFLYNFISHPFSVNNPPHTNTRW